MSTAFVTAYLSPTMARKRAIRSGESGGVDGLAIFIVFSWLLVLLSLSGVPSIPRHRGAAQPVVDGFAEPVVRHRHDGDAARAAQVEGAKIAEEIGGRLRNVAIPGQIHHRNGRVNSRDR